jgi:hypothetical protein
MSRFGHTSGRMSRDDAALRTKRTSELRPAPEGHLHERIGWILDEARSRMARAINTAMVQAYWLLGARWKPAAAARSTVSRSVSGKFATYGYDKYFDYAALIEEALESLAEDRALRQTARVHPSGRMDLPHRQARPPRAAPVPLRNRGRHRVHLRPAVRRHGQKDGAAIAVEVPESGAST